MISKLPLNDQAQKINLLIKYVKYIALQPSISVRWGRQRDRSLQPSSKWTRTVKLPSVRIVAKLGEKMLTDHQIVEIVLAVLIAQGKIENLDLPGAGQGPGTGATGVEVIPITRKTQQLLKMVSYIFFQLNAYQNSKLKYQKASRAIILSLLKGSFFN